MFDQIEWISVEERKPCGYIVVDESVGYVEPAEYLVHVKGAQIPTTAMYFDGKFLVNGVAGFGGEVDYWAEMPRWNH